MTIRDNELAIDMDGDLEWEHDDDCEGECDGDWYADDGQPDEYTEWQDYMGGDDSEYGTWGDY